MPNRRLYSDRTLRATCSFVLAAGLHIAALPYVARAQDATPSLSQAAAQMRALGYDPDSVYFVFQVQQPVKPVPGAHGPVYPPLLKSAGTEGDVILAFVVDTAGRVEPKSVRVLLSHHGLFTEAARAAVDSTTFVPARLRGQAVRQLVQQPFQFRIPK